MKEETRAFIEELKRKKQDKIDNGPIDMTADQMWKYSGQIEENKDDFYPPNPYHYRHKIVKNVVIYNTFSTKDDLIIDAYFRNSNIPMTELAESLAVSAGYVRKVLDKYFEMKRNENENIDNE